MTISAKARQRVVVLLTSIALALALLLTGSVVARADDAPAPSSTFVGHTVATGDTLWEIAGEYAGAGVDLRNLVSDIKRVNDLDSSVIMPGQRLRIPIVP